MATLLCLHGATGSGDTMSVRNAEEPSRVRIGEGP